MTAHIETVRIALLEAALPHVAFDGWTEATFEAAIRDSDVEPSVARSVCPRGALDLAIAYHKAGDAAMVAAYKRADTGSLKIREKVTLGVRLRIEAITDREAVRRGTTLFALPQNAADGAQLVWGTADTIWTTIGDTSNDVNWYTKRAILSGVYGSTVLFWLGDDSEGAKATWEFLDRRIENVMQIEKVKAQVNGNPIAKRLLTVPNMLLSQIKAPAMMPPADLPGQFTNPER